MVFIIFSLKDMQGKPGRAGLVAVTGTKNVLALQHGHARIAGMRPLYDRMAGRIL